MVKRAPQAVRPFTFHREAGCRGPIVCSSLALLTSQSLGIRYLLLTAPGVGRTRSGPFDIETQEK
jgi:hypothetical protein